MASGGYSINGYWWLFNLWLLVDFLFVAISDFSICGYWWLLVDFLFVGFGGYYINGY
jgi:hypothetical protein